MKQVNLLSIPLHSRRLSPLISRQKLLRPILLKEPSSQPSLQVSMIDTFFRGSIATIVLIFFLVVYPQPSISSAPTLYDRPSSQPSTQPSSQPSMNPSMAPSSQPSETPSANPSQGCANTRTDCGWGIFNPWTCRCDCPAGICLDNNEQCYLPC